MVREQRLRYSPIDHDTSDESGWPTVVDYMKTYDESMMKDYSDDIDALLVLAGLFSAVLTAFIVESYTSLQEDNSESSVQLLSRISAQLESYQVQAPFVNSTLGPPPLSSPFEPTSAARWVNSLWFLSLLFSLAAAVIGILAKQWIREYQKWNEATASPRENVLVRRLRYESWEVWHTAAIISSIPAMLELAVVLFVCGLIVFLWTVDIIVAIVVTVCSAIFLVAVSTLTLLPAFFKRCPYKSPTAWAFVLAVATVKRIVLSMYQLAFAVMDASAASWERYAKGVKTHSRALLASVHGEERENYDWRRRDIVGGSAKTYPDADGEQLDSAALMAIVRKEMSEISDDLSFASLSSAILGERIPDIAPRCTSIASEPMHLFSALMWSAAVSNKENFELIGSLQSCAKSLYRPMKTLPLDVSGAAESAIVRGIRHVAIWTLFDGLFSYSLQTSRENEKIHPALAVRLWLRSRYTVGTVGPTSRPLPMFILHEPSSNSKPEMLSVARSFTPQAHISSFTGSFMSQERISHHTFSIMLAQEIKTSVVEVLTFGIWIQPDDGLFKRRVAELLAAFQHTITVTKLEKSSTWMEQSLPIMLETFMLICNSHWRPQFDFMFPGLRSSLLEVVWRHSPVRAQSGSREADDGKVELRLCSPYEDDSDMWLALAGVDFTPAGSPSREDCYIHHDIVSNAISSLQKASGEPEYLAHHISEMLRRTTALLTSAKDLKWTNGGTYAGRLPWLAPLFEYECLTAKFLCRTAPEEFETFVTAMETSGELIVDGEIAVKKLRSVLETRPLSTTPIITDSTPRIMYPGPSRPYIREPMPDYYRGRAAVQYTLPKVDPSNDIDEGKNGATSAEVYFPRPVHGPQPDSGSLGRYHPYPPPEVDRRDLRQEFMDYDIDFPGRENVQRTA